MSVGILALTCAGRGERTRPLVSVALARFLGGWTFPAYPLEQVIAIHGDANSLAGQIIVDLAYVLCEQFRAIFVPAALAGTGRGSPFTCPMCIIWGLTTSITSSRTSNSSL